MPRIPRWVGVELRARGLLWQEALRAGLLRLHETQSGPILLPRASGGVPITYYWVGGAGTWDGSATTHWSLLSGGSSGAGPPDADDIATFDANSGLGSGGTVTVASTAVCGGCVIGGINSKTVIFSFSGNVTWNAGTYTFAGNDATTPIIFQSSTTGTARTVTINGTHTGHSWVHFMDITIAGSAGTLTGTLIGDCGGNSGITFDASSTQTATGTASFTWSTHAFTGSGATHNPPLPQDDVVISNAFVAGRTVTADMPRLGRGINMSAATGSPAFSLSQNSLFFGSWAFAAGMTTNSSASQFIASGRSVYTLTSAAVTMNIPLTVTAPGGTYTLQDNWDNGVSRMINVSAGTFVDNAKTVTCQAFGSTGGTTRVVTLTGTWNLAGTGSINVWNVTNIGSSLTLTATAVTLNITSTDSAVTKTFIGGGGSYGTLKHTTTGSAALIITGSNTFTGLNLDSSSARAVTIPTGTNTKVVGGVCSITGLITLTSATPGTLATIDALRANPVILSVPLSSDISVLRSAPVGSRWR